MDSKKDIRTAFKSSTNLKIFYVNKSKLFPNSYPGVYELHSSCQSRHPGKTKENFISCNITLNVPCISESRIFFFALLCSASKRFMP